MDAYRELGATLAVALELSSRLQSGVALAYTFAQARGFAAEHLVVLNAQMVFWLDAQTAVGIVGRNLTQSSRAGSSAGASSAFTIGCSRMLATPVWIDADIALPLRMPAGLTLALRWDIIDDLAVRCAATTVPQSGEVSFRLLLPSNLALVGTLHYHTALGISPTVGVAYQW